MRKSRNLLYAIIIDGVVLGLLIALVQPDPKGIGLSLVTGTAGILATIVGSFVLFLRSKRDSFLYAWASVTGVVNFFPLFQIVSSIICCGMSDITFFSRLIILIFLCGAPMSVYMLSRLLKR